VTAVNRAIVSKVLPAKGLKGRSQFLHLLARAATSPLPPFRRFAKGLRKDCAAVMAGVTLPWSQGPIEGQINRLKMLKRSMFGRAKLDLLSQRFLLTA
jgi:transposase